VAISCADVPTQPRPPTGQQAGIDLGLEAFATRANGERLHSPGCLRTADRFLAKCQRRVARRKKGRHRRRTKAVALLAKAYQTVGRQRRDFHHQTALALVRQYDAISHEDLRVANMVQNHHLAKSISDAGWSAFLSILSFTAACAGREVGAVDPAFTSQTCSGCGIMVTKGLAVRWQACPECGTSLHRDQNAARNIQARGQQGRGQRLRGVPALAGALNREPAGR
jgi:putative transposase